MSVADLYKVLVVSQKVIIRRYDVIIYVGFIESIPLDCMGSRVLGIETLYKPNNTIIIIIE